MNTFIGLGLLAQLCLVFGTTATLDETDVEYHVHPLHRSIWKGRKSNNQHPRFQNMRFGTLSETSEQRAGRPFISHSIKNATLPEAFDAREKWGNWLHIFGHCKHIGTIRDQSNCESSWAFAAVQAMGDRMCIHSNYKFNQLLSASHLLSCCDACGHGCDGITSAYNAWHYWLKQGIPTEKCEPYPFPPCDHHVMSILPTCRGRPYKEPSCHGDCTDKRHSMEEELTYGSNFYYLHRNEKEIMYELMTRGPLEMVMTVYEDFITYESGVYFNAFGNELGKHAVRLIGWGEEKGTRYWTLANSWNEGWGEKGFFRIIRGYDECDIEQNAIAGMPKPY